MVVTILHQLPSGVVASYPPSADLMALMMGEGLGWDDGAIAREVTLRMTPATRNSWPGYSRAISEEWAAAVGRGGLTEAQALDLFTRFTKERQGSLATFLTNTDDLPDEFLKDRYFRDAIVWDDTAPAKCRCNMDACRVIHMDKIRLARNAELDREDVNMLRAIESGDTSEQSIISSRKQALRDIPQTFDLTTDSTSILQGRWPSELPARES
jgi:hypothetical protein